MYWWDCGFCMNEIGPAMCMCVYCICHGNQTAALERASWEGPSGAKGEIQENILLLKQLQQLLHVLPYAHMRARLPSCPSHTSPLPQTLLHNPVTKYFSTLICAEAEAFRLLTRHTSPVRLSCSYLPFPMNALPCPTTRWVSKAHLQEVFCWHHNRPSSQDGRLASTEGLKWPVKGLPRDCWNALLSCILSSPPFLTVFSHELKWWCPAAPSNQRLSEG